MYFYLYDKRLGQVLPTVYSCEPFFFFHVINSFQKDDSYVTVDIIAYKDAEVRQRIELKSISLICCEM